MQPLGPSTMHARRRQGNIDKARQIVQKQELGMNVIGMLEELGETTR